MQCNLQNRLVEIDGHKKEMFSGVRKDMQSMEQKRQRLVEEFRKVRDYFVHDVAVFIILSASVLFSWSFSSKSFSIFHILFFFYCNFNFLCPPFLWFKFWKLFLCNLCNLIWAVSLSCCVDIVLCMFDYFLGEQSACLTC